MHQLIHDKGGIKMLGFLNKSKTPGHCIFPLANPHSGESVYYVPESNPLNHLILLCICSGNTQPVRPFLLSFRFYNLFTAEIYGFIEFWQVPVPA